MYLVMEYLGGRSGYRPKIDIKLNTADINKAYKAIEDSIQSSIVKYGYSNETVADLLSDLKKKCTDTNKCYEVKLDDNEIGCIQLQGGHISYYYDYLVKDIVQLTEIK